MDDRDLVYFVNSKGKTAFLSTPDSKNYWEMKGRSGFTAPQIDNFYEKFASGNAVYFGKALKPRHCSMKMLCKGRNSEECDRVFYNMLSVLLDADGSGEGRLYIKRPNAERLYLNCVYSGGMDIAEQYRKYKKFSIEFFAANPWFYAVKKSCTLYDMTQTNPRYTLQYTNPTNVNQIFELNFCNPERDWGIQRSIVNASTEKKLTFVNTTIFPNEDFDKKYSLYARFEQDRIDIRMNGSDGTKKDGTSVFDWNNTDKDFYIIPGENIITIADFSTGADFNLSTISILEHRAGV